ncbi:MAG: methionyl-tRNA formyltransferase [Arcobacteraceae bacterium]|nr:methionyl-tRNA formyltransferase [Arcobacteraceae bacterium]
MKIVFIGTVEFSLSALNKLIDINAQVVGVVTKKNSNFNSDFANLTPICKKNNIPCIYSDDINSTNTISQIKSLKPDIIFCFGWSSLIKTELLNLTPMGIVGFHPTQLPKNRGRHPIIWTLALGLKSTASTFFFMNEEADNGDILSQKILDVTYTDNAKTLYDKITNTALIQIEDFVPKLQNNTYAKTKQNNLLSNTWRKRDKKDGLIDFRMSNDTIYNLVRALTKPYVGAHIEYNNKDVIIWKVEAIPYDGLNIEAGKILQVKDNEIMVKTSHGAINIIEHEFIEIPKKGDYL